MQAQRHRVMPRVGLTARGIAEGMLFVLYTLSSSRMRLTAFPPPELLLHLWVS